VRSDISWAKVLKLLVVNHLIHPGSEFYIHRQWFDKTAMDELLNTDYRIAAKDISTRDSHEWWLLKGLLRRKLPHRQEGTYELEDTALAAKRKQELPLEAISSIGA